MTFEVFRRPKIEPPHSGRTADCGTVSGYVAHIRAEEEPDAACREAWTSWHTSQYAHNTVYRSKKVRLNVTRDLALRQLADLYPDEFQRMYDAELPGGHRRDRAWEALRKSYQPQFDELLTTIREAVPPVTAPDRRRKDNR